MKFVCDRCQTKYSIADERVRGKVLKVKCKTCANVITVREAKAPSAGGLPTLSGAAGARPRTGALAALTVPEETPGIDSERTQLAQSPFGPEADPFPDLGAIAPVAPPTARRTTGPLAPAAVDDGVQWYMALDGNRTGPFTRQKLVDRLLPLAKGADVHIWNERLDGWKAPADVHEIAGEIARRRAPPPAPPLPGAPRRPTPPPIPPLGSLTGPAPAHGQAARKPTGPHAPPSPVGHGPGGPSKLPPPGGVHPALAARGAEPGGDPSSLLETPAPMPNMLPHPAPQKTNGVGGHAPPRPSSSDVMQMLNLPGGMQTVPGAPPRLMSITSAIGTQAAPVARSRSPLLILALLAVIAAVVVVAVISLKKPTKTAVPIVKPPVAEPVALKEPEPPPPEPVAVKEPEPPLAPPGKGKKGGRPARGAAAKAQPVATDPGTATTAGTGGSDAARFSDNRKMNITGGGASPRLPPPAQSDITRVISNNRANIKVCYQRALTRDNTLTRGKLAVKLSIGISGRVKHMSLDGPSQFKILLEPCIKEVVTRWAFPPASEEYGTEFPLVFQGNE